MTIISRERGHVGVFKSEDLKEAELKKSKQKEIIKIIENHCINTDTEAKKIIDLLKENCTTYGELKKEIKKLKKSGIWNRKPEEINLIERCEDLVKEEMNDLKIITHS